MDLCLVQFDIFFVLLSSGFPSCASSGRFAHCVLLRRLPSYIMLAGSLSSVSERAGCCLYSSSSFFLHLFFSLGVTDIIVLVASLCDVSCYGVFLSPCMTGVYSPCQSYLFLLHVRRLSLPHVSLFNWWQRTCPYFVCLLCLFLG